MVDGVGYLILTFIQPPWYRGPLSVLAHTSALSKVEKVLILPARSFAASPPQ
jgi:hypothetical protein